MATPFHLPVTAAQVGTYFVGHYYQVLQTQPDFVHQFYSDRSTLLRVDGPSRETATSMLQIHALVMSLNYTGIEIKTVHSLESWDRGVLVLVSGSVHIKDFSGRRNFVQTFFLAPQEKGYFVLNDIFHFIEDQPIHHHPVAYLTQNDLVSKLNGSTALRDQASSYMAANDIQARDFVPPTTAEENGPVNNYSYQEQQLRAPEAESILEDNYAVQSNGSVQNSVNAPQDHLAPVEEAVGEPQKHTYASILQVAKVQSAPSAQPVTKSTAHPDMNHVPEPPAQQSASLSTGERSGAEAVEDTSVMEDEAEVKSVYVRNVPSTAIASDIEEEFMKFGKIRQDGVAIRTRKDIDVCYAFVEFEDITGVQNAIKASTAEIAGQQVHIEGRRPNRSNAYRGGRGRGRGRVSNQMDGRGRFGGRNYGSRGNGQDGNDRDYNRPRGNGYYRQAPRQDRAYSNSQQASRNGHSISD
ncbi:putative G3BP-like protein isoform X2 [Cynara cardunculus var. scolymus]|uniref:Nuclear transport factor 2 n=1 Tax=Cynara cardunculus var. scolymus TaxID=59895 RepID=A0A103Y0S2_CYNCS|nr:putative G3BP-like protein isoform X2 [Cynara cardunculus var. scolymus]KVI00416.1 Nuclear transport factor 2 [Cynara cardunculus var. scolymus]